MKTISEDYKIYLTEDKTLLFYGTLKNQELDKPQIVINDSTGVFTMLAEEMAKKSRDEIFDISMKFQQENGELPEVVQAMLSAVLFDD
ncbi:MAG: hypothetical protein KHX37_00540 [Eubacterium sp.]|nr:hypothetical protein [Eubacterium sp.]